MTMYIKDQIYMNTLAGCGSFTAAASRLGISQPALSKWLTCLESELGVTLAIRRKKGIVLTEAGQIYLDGCRCALSCAQKVQEDIAHLQDTRASHTVTLGGSPIRGADCFVNIYVAFRQHFPDVSLRFVQDSAPALRRAVACGDISLAIIGAGSTDSEEIEYMKFMDEELVFMVPRDSRLGYPPDTHKSLPIIDLSLLKDFPLLITEGGTSHTAIISELYEQHSLSGNIMFRSDLLPVLYKLVKQGVGAAFIPYAYYDPSDPVSVYRYAPRIIVYQGIGIRRDRRLSSAEEYLIHLIISHWHAPQYMHQYADYYLSQRRLRIGTV